MNKVINGKRYDTEKAQRVASWDNERFYSDFSHYAESLYKKRTGEFFLYCEGGAQSRLGHYVCGGTLVGGEEIVPISYSKAQEWAEKKLDADGYSAIFGEPEEEEQCSINATLSAAARAKLDRAASESGKSRSQIIGELIEAM